MRTEKCSCFPLLRSEGERNPASQQPPDIAEILQRPYPLPTPPRFFISGARSVTVTAASHEEEEEATAKKEGENGNFPTFSAAAIRGFFFASPCFAISFRIQIKVFGGTGGVGCQGLKCVFPLLSPKSPAAKAYFDRKQADSLLTHISTKIFPAFFCLFGPLSTFTFGPSRPFSSSPSSLNLSTNPPLPSSKDL